MPRNRQFSRQLHTALVAAAAVAVIVALPALATTAQEVETAAQVEVADAAASAPVETPGAPMSPGVERGRYLSHEVAMCVQCHSPRDRRGELREDQLFTGAPLPVSSPFEGAPRWAFTAPNLRNLPGYTEEQFLHFMMTGLRPNGTEARGPMPPFRMTREDAQAVYDYLTSY